LDGRPVDRHADIAVLPRGLVFANAIDLTKCFDGLITLSRDGAATITIGPNTGTFVPGSSRATINAAAVALPGPPFTRDGELFVPLAAFIADIAGARLRYSRATHHADIRVNTRRSRLRPARRYGADRSTSPKKSVARTFHP
jgi:hypothetical protein